ncbi:hypothetical protein J8L85_16515 [Maribacter sp. MMG018]|uniref:coiled-coil domain-containing protein n=1 Tax=Maribacter sp. MMG018 TaxID=2822688 RepID=UPI001B3905D7|nr:hypothetical protein [Maribacter sp. MMG018]MBQ4916059.1 hypothetical protein [Maribacter sp. MMG018]
MKTITVFVLVVFTLFVTHEVTSQEEHLSKIEFLKGQKEKIALQEKDALKLEVAKINKQLERNEISEEEAQKLKTEAAQKRALNIENRLGIIDNQIALLERNGEDPMQLDTLNYATALEIGFGGKDSENNRMFGVSIKENPNRKDVKYDKRTYSDLVVALGFNNAIIDEVSLNDSPYKIGGSRFFELGWQWRTRVFKESNFLRLNYGFSFQFNGLKIKDNQYFVVNGDGNAELEEFDYELDKSKFRMDNLVFPVHLEFGPSKLKKTEKTIRYSLTNQFRFGIGGYGGFNLGTRQKLKYSIDGEKVKDKIKRDYNTNDLVYGLSAYAGFDGVLLYMKYDLNTIFNNAPVDQRNISIGLRFDL